MPWWALGYVLLWVVSLAGNLVYRRRMKCSLPRFAASSFAGAIAVFFVISFWHPELSDRIRWFLPVMAAYMLATDVSMMMWVMPVVQREWATVVDDACDSADEDPESQQALRMLMDVAAWLIIPLAIVGMLLFLLPAYVLAAKVCLR